MRRLDQLAEIAQKAVTIGTTLIKTTRVPAASRSDRSRDYRFKQADRADRLPHGCAD
jgi:hypothetical protein